MAEQANIQLRSDAEIGVQKFVTEMTERLIYSVMDSVGESAGAAIPIFNMISQLITGIVDMVNAKYETTLNVFNNYEPYDLPFKTKDGEAVAKDVQKWFELEKTRRTPKTIFKSPAVSEQNVESKLFNIMEKIFTPKMVIIAGSLVVVSGLIWFFINKKKS